MYRYNGYYNVLGSEFTDLACRLVNATVRTM